jgi:type I restriction enzyme S subunit
MTEGGDFDKLGRGSTWDGQISGCLHQNHIFAVRPRSRELQSRYLALLTTASHGRAYFTKTSQQTTNLATTDRRKIGSFPVPVPLLEEQARIVQFVEAQTYEFDTLNGKIQAAIDRLKEYRTALISAAVTGKIDVREEVGSG